MSPVLSYIWANLRNVLKFPLLLIYLPAVWVQFGSCCSYVGPLPQHMQLTSLSYSKIWLSILRVVSLLIYFWRVCWQFALVQKYATATNSLTFVVTCAWTNTHLVLLQPKVKHKWQNKKTSNWITFQCMTSCWLQKKSGSVKVLICQRASSL